MVTARLEHPVGDPPIIDGGNQHSKSWTAYFQSVNDQVAGLNDEVAGLTTQLGSVGQGVTDGSDAAAGMVGEYLTASGSGVGLTNNVMTTVATLTLTAGDWDVYGVVTFHLTGATTTHYAAGLDGTFGTEIIATVPAGSGVWQLQAGTVRRNVTGTTAVLLQGLCGFSAGSVSADGTIRARRMR